MEIHLARSGEFEYDYGEMPELASIGEIHFQQYTQETEWQTFHADIGQALISEMQAAHDTGEFVFLVFRFQSELGPYSSIRDLSIHMDNVSFRVNGIQKVPSMQGRIAYYEVIGESSPEDGEERANKAINILDPNTRSVNTILESEHLISDRNEVKWKPDGTEIAFVSTQDNLFSPYSGDIFTINSGGGGLRKVTSQPSQEEIINGDYPRVTLTGSIRNDASVSDPSEETVPNSFIFCPKGADECTTISVGSGGTVPFSIENVAVLQDSDTFEQPAYIYWSNNLCSNGLEFESLIGIINNGVVDVGTISFNASICDEDPWSNYPHWISWQKDGSAVSIGVNSTLRKFDSTTGLPLLGESVPYDGFFPRNLEWSPVDNRYLFTASRSSYISDNVYLMDEGREAQLLVEGVRDVSPAWLLDGSGFIFVDDDFGSSGDNIYSYDLNTRESEQLTYFNEVLISNIRISSDSGHILFTRCSDPSHCSLWIMDRLNPVEMWPITDEGHIDSPDWSRVEVAGSNSQNNDSDDSGGSGGCFIKCVIGAP
jgi:hypothetical protein